jgi:HSP20 family protein
MEKITTKVPAKRDEGLRSPWHLFEELRNEMDELWNRPWLPFRMARTQKAWLPTTDVFRSNGDLVVKADLPGMKREDIEVSIDNGDLVLSGERKHEEEVKEENLYRCERSHGRFFRRLPLPFEIEAAKISATFTDGVLEVHVPLPREEIKAQKIAVS